jgi:Protein of unknown function (DUF3558)
MTDPHRRTLAAAAALAMAGCVLLAACGNSAPAAQTDAPAVRTTADATPTTSVAPTDPTSTDATPAAAPTAGTTACELVTEQEVGTVLGKDPGAGSAFTSHGASQCQYGNYATAFVLVNVTPTQGKAAYDLMHSKSNLGHGLVIADVAGLGDRAFQITGPNTASIYIDKGDALVLVMVEIRTATSPPKDQALALAKTAANRV